MEDYRSLTEEEITQLEEQGCIAEDWTAINVDENFQPFYIRNVCFYGEVNLGVFEKNIEVGEGFMKHSGICNAVLKDVNIGDNTLIEGVGNYINNYDIGEECYISNIGKISTAADATFGNGNIISVQNESGDGNVILFSELTSQLAALMIRHANDKVFKKTLRSLINDYIGSQQTERGVIGYRVKIVNTTEITNTIINDDCEICGASRICECSILSTPEASSYIGNDVILDNSILQEGSSVLDGAKVDNCFVGEACHIGKGASAEASLFFANSYLDNGEACAAFCGPFTVSHHKSSLLIGGEYSFYNAGSNTNYSNHAYKMGAIHWGTLERGSKTASGAHILWPATIGAFSMCMGKVQTHPRVSSLPFSYLFGEKETTYLIPGRNLTTVGTYRDVCKWIKRDMRPQNGRKSIINFDWLNPVVITECIDGISVLQQLQQEQGYEEDTYLYQGCTIKRKALLRGINYYEKAILLFIGQQFQKQNQSVPDDETGIGRWEDLCGMIAPSSEIEKLLQNIKDGVISDFHQLSEEFLTIHQQYENWKWNFTHHLIIDHYQLSSITEPDFKHILENAEQAHVEWISAIRDDAKKEYQMGDVSEELLNEFLDRI